MSEYEEDEIYATLVEINEEPIELYKVLKIGNLVSGGGEAKQLISEGYVFLNGEEETRKRKKVYAGDLISFNGEHLQVALKGQTDHYEMIDEDLEFTNDEADANNIVDNKVSKQEKAKSTPTKRKPISF